MNITLTHEFKLSLPATRPLYATIDVTFAFEVDYRAREIQFDDIQSIAITALEDEADTPASFAECTLAASTITLEYLYHHFPADMRLLEETAEEDAFDQLQSHFDAAADFQRDCQDGR